MSREIVEDVTQLINELEQLPYKPRAIRVHPHTIQIWKLEADTAGPHHPHRGKPNPFHGITILPDLTMHPLDWKWIQ